LIDAAEAALLLFRAKVESECDGLMTRV